MGNPKGVKRDFLALEKRRFRALALLKKGYSRPEVATILGVCRQSITRWENKAIEEGRDAVKWNGRAGRLSRLTKDQKEALREFLVKGPLACGFDSPVWTCRRVAQLIKREFKVQYHHDHVWKILTHLGFSVQKPVRRAKERNEEQIANWKARDWPRIKKKPENRAV